MAHCQVTGSADKAANEGLNLQPGDGKADLISILPQGPCVFVNLRLNIV